MTSKAEHHNSKSSPFTPDSEIRTPDSSSDGQPSPLDYLIQGGLILSLSPEFPKPFIGSIGIQRGKIVYLEADGGSSSPPPAHKIIKARGHLILPGLINAHTHAAMTLFRGMADDLPLQVWLEEHIFPAESRYIHPESVYWGTLLACAEMILSGTTTFSDGYFCQEGAVGAVKQAGMRAVLCQGVIDFPAPGVMDPAQNVSTAQRFVEQWQGFSPLIQTGIFCHSPYTCSARTLTSVKDFCRAKELPFYIHAAETREEVSILLAREAKTPVRYLHSLGLLDSRTVAVHAIHVDFEEIDLLAAAETAVVHCPESNMKLASGKAPVMEMLRREVSVGLGTDGSASNNDLDLLKEMDTAAKMEKVYYLDPTALGAHLVLQMATTGSARVLGLEKKIGSLEVGKEADLIGIDLKQPHLFPCYDPFSTLVYSAQGSDVSWVMIGGRLIMENRRILSFDLEEVLERVRYLSRTIIAERGKGHVFF
jgi:5-methylthioadenosine/S-adenosylhomocysteine deaminase